MTFIERLNLVQDRLISPDILRNSGLGNEIGFYIFDYPAKQELIIRAWLKDLPKKLHSLNPDLRFEIVNLFSFLIDYLKSRNIYEKVLSMQKEKGNEYLAKALRGPLDAAKMIPFFEKTVKPANQHLVILYGIGEAYPLLRAHYLLNNLQNIMNSTPLVLFYPGEYDKQQLRLFGKLPAENYYRAFRLIP